ncbi:MAG: metal-dependent hydrolase [Candidatus Nanohaloarchaea archaeon]|nr:metal-dependent hydrolase [Candidatus Nanohaloarchaea archaeon]
MDSLFHFVFAFIAGMAVNVRLDHRPLWVVLVAFSAVLIDIDHLLFLAGALPYKRAFHSFLVVGLLPAALFYASYRYERGSESIRYQSLSLLLFVMLTGHVVADLFNEGAVPLLYPLSSLLVTLPQGLEATVLQEGWHVVTPESVSLALYGAIIGAAYYTEELIYFFEQQHETVETAVKDAFST